jgi:iron complex transport system ATP-binding protein
LLQAADVSFAYGQAPVLQGVSFTIARGSMLGILGPNGSGKTTLLKLLAGVLAPRAGRVLLDGRDLQTIPRRRLARRLAVVPQDTRLAFEYRVLEVALMGRHPYLGPFEIEGPEDLAAARRALDATGTLPLADRAFETLSGGERQRVVIASALTQFEDAGGDASSGDGRVLLLDEPTASLDVHYQVEVGALLARLNRRRGLTIVVSTHDLNFAAGVCEHLILLREGRILAMGPSATVLTRESVQALYGIDADVRYHEAAGHLTVVPLLPGGITGDPARERRPPR